MTSPNSPQDQNNLMLAVILSLLVLVGWQYFFASPMVKEEQARKCEQLFIRGRGKGGKERFGRGDTRATDFFRQGFGGNRRSCNRKGQSKVSHEKLLQVEHHSGRMPLTGQVGKV